MKKIIWTTALCCLGALAVSAPVSAFEIPLDQSLCPIETIGEAEIDIWGDTLATTNGELSDAQLKSLSDAIASCSQTHGWNDDDTRSVLDFNISIIAATAIADKLTSNGVDAAAYETVLDDATEEDLQQVLQDAENSAAIKKLTEMMIADLGENLTEQIAGDLGAYIAFMAQAQYSSLKMLGLSE